MSDQGLDQAVARMRAAKVSEAAVAVFAHLYRKCEAGDSGIIPEDSIRPLLDPPRFEDIQVSDADAEQALSRTVVIKLNGGLGTSMGLDAAKTLLPVREGKSFLDIIATQVLHARREHGARLPLLFMDSFRTREDTLAHLSRYPDLPVEGLPLDFLQNREPKLRRDDLTPVDWPADPSLEWCPPGHGDIYAALWGSGILDRLLEAGFRYASLANGDNLGAAPDARIAGWFAGTGAPYAAEVCRRTPNDRKGGHLAIRRSDGRLILRDSAQTADDEQKYFQDETVHPFFHANNLWLDLEQVRAALADRDGVLGLPLIRNEKTVDPTDPGSTPVVQLETAMGAAVEVFEGALAIEVPRDRFLPVKTTNELMLLRSDVFDLGEDGRLVQTSPIPRIDLASRYYKLVRDFEARVKVAPSLSRAHSLVVRGDWTFDRPASVVGDLTLPDDGVAHRFEG